MNAYPIRIEQVPGIPLAVVRRRASPAELATLVPECCGLVWSAIRNQGLKGGRNVAVYRDAAMNVDIGVEMDGPFAERDGVVRSFTPSGAVASATHFGSYRDLGAAHAAIRDWCRAHRRPLAGPSWELYGHWRNEWNDDPSPIRTDVFYLLAPEGAPAG